MVIDGSLYFNTIESELLYELGNLVCKELIRHKISKYEKSAYSILVTPGLILTQSKVFYTPSITDLLQLFLMLASLITILAQGVEHTAEQGHHATHKF